MQGENTMDLGRGFLKLQEDNNSRRSSSLFRHKPLELNENGLHYVTRINCGCGQCVPFRVKVEKDDGGLRIGKLTLATNCHLIIVIFGFFFLIAGSVLTALAYKEPIPDPDLPPHARASTEQLDSPSRQEGKIAGPIFIIVGSALVLMGFTLTALSCKLNREAKRQLHLSRFTWETPPIQTPDIFNNSNTTSHHHSVSSDHYATFSTNNLDTYSVRSRELSTGSAGSVAARRNSSFTFHRQQQHPPPPLSTITQAVPVGIFLFGSNNDQATASPKSPTIQVTDPSGFQEIELGSPTTESAPTSASAFSRGGGGGGGSSHANGIPGEQYNNYQNQHQYSRKHRSQSDGNSLENVSRGGSASSGGSSRGKTNRNLNPADDPTGQNKVNLALRPSLPIIPMFASSPHYFSRVVTPLDARSLYVSSRSDEPFGSIASLSTSGDIACFPVSSSSSSTAANGGGGSGAANNNSNNNIISMQPTPECDDEESSTTSTSSVVTAPIRISDNANITYSSGGANNNANNNKQQNTNGDMLMERNRKNDANSNNSTSSSSSSSSCNDSYSATDVTNNKTSSISSISIKGISELPPINVNDFGSKMNSSSSGGSSNGAGSVSGGGGFSGNVTGAAVGFRPKSILRQSQNEDWKEGNNCVAGADKSVAMDDTGGNGEKSGETEGKDENV